jgi:hypothetical protein
MMVMDTAQRKFALPPLPLDAALALSRPIKAGGFGLTQAAAVSVPAYFCALSAASSAIAHLIPGDVIDQVLFDAKTQAPFAREAEVCLTTLIDAGVTHGPGGLIPSTFADLWLPGGRWSDLSRRQHCICSQLTACEFNAWFASARLKAKQRVQSASAPNAGLWLTTFPSTPELTLADEFFVLAVKHRLGLRPIEDLPAHCACGAKLSVDPQHFYSCGQLKRKAMTVRHDSVVRLLRDSFHHVGAVVHVEPRLYDTTRVRPDLDVLLPNLNLMLDVAVTHPGAPSRKSDRCLAAANDLQATKNRRYKDWALARGGMFLPFVCETHGALGHQADEVIKLLAKAASNTTLTTSVRDFMMHFRQALSVTLQRGNGLVAKMGAISARATAATAERAARLR